MSAHGRNPLELPVEEAPEEIRRQRGVEQMSDEEQEEGRVVQLGATMPGKSQDGVNQGEDPDEEQDNGQE